MSLSVCDDLNALNGGILDKEFFHSSDEHKQNKEEKKRETKNEEKRVATNEKTSEATNEKKREIVGKDTLSAGIKQPCNPEEGEGNVILYFIEFVTSFIISYLKIQLMVGTAQAK